jgi:hypothetical protein
MLNQHKRLWRTVNKILTPSTLELPASKTCVVKLITLLCGASVAILTSENESYSFSSSSDISTDMGRLHISPPLTDVSFPLHLADLTALKIMFLLSVAGSELSKPLDQSGPCLQPSFLPKITLPLNNVTLRLQFYYNEHTVVVCVCRPSCQTTISKVTHHSHFHLLPQAVGKLSTNY